MNVRWVARAAAASSVIVVLALAPATMSASASTDSKKKPDKADPKASVAWFYADAESTFFRFAAVVENKAKKALDGVRVEWTALDATGVLVGSRDRSLPTIPARGSFVYVGGAGGLNLTGVPASVDIKVLDRGRLVKKARPAFAIDSISLAPEQFQSGPTPEYLVSANATVRSSKPVTSAGLVAIAVLRDAAGLIVGADFTPIENVPQILDPGTKFRVLLEFVRATGTPATAEVTVDRGGTDA